MTPLTGQILSAACGAGVGGGIYLIIQGFSGRGTSLVDDLEALYATPEPPRSAGRPVDAAGQWVNDALQRAGLQRILLQEQLAVAGRPVDAHTTIRLLHALTGAGIALAVWATGAALSWIPLPLAPLAVLFGGITGVWVADRRVRRLAEFRRREAQLAVAAYLDLVRILLVGGLPLLAALRAAADSGSGWSFSQLSQALSWAQDRSLPPDDGLQDLADRVGIPEFADLALTVASARRGASPIQALESKAQFMRGAATAQTRAEAAIADAQIELPAAAVALAFMVFLAYALMSLINTGTGVLP